MMEEKSSKPSDNLERDERGRLLPGQESLNPAGRPKGKTLKEFAREYYMLKTDEEKRAYIDELEKKIPGFSWRMAEGNPQTDVTSGGEKIEPFPILVNVLGNNSNAEDNGAQKKD